MTRTMRPHPNPSSPKEKTQLRVQYWLPSQESQRDSATKPGLERSDYPGNPLRPFLSISKRLRQLVLLCGNLRVLAHLLNPSLAGMSSTPRPAPSLPPLGAHRHLS